MADMIAMLNGLGAYGEFPIGDVDPATSARIGQTSPGTGLSNEQITVYNPQPYTLGKIDDEEEGLSGTTWLFIVLGLGAAAWGISKMVKSASPEPGEDFLDGIAEPEMIELNAPPARTRGKGKR
jgi:hypothetical protein